MVSNTQAACDCSCVIWGLISSLKWFCSIIFSYSRGFRQATRGSDTGAFHHPFFRRDEPELCVKMVCQKSRDRQQGPQKQRSLPPKKRSVAGAAPPTYPSSHQAVPSTTSSVDSSTTAYPSFRLAQLATPVIVDDRTGNASTATQTASFCNSMTVNGNKGYVATSNMTSPLAPNTATVSAAAVNSSTTKTDSSKSSGASGMMPFICNDPKFVASTLRRRESLEVYRAAKAMLYDAYLKAVNEKR